MPFRTHFEDFPLGKRGQLRAGTLRKAQAPAAQVADLLRAKAPRGPVFQSQSAVHV